MAISMLRIAAVPLLASVLGIGSAAAATINYSEAVDGQLSAFPLSLGVAGIGTNTVAGSLAGTCVPSDCNANPGGSSGNSQDSFKIQILAGTSLASVFVTTSNVTGPAGFSAAYDQSPGSILTSLPLGTTSANLLSSALGPGTYTVSLFGGGANDAGPYSLDYSVAFNVVPIPAAAWLFGGALGLMGWLRRRPAAS